METYLETAARNLSRAREILRRSGIREAWEEAGAEVRTVGSLRTGLLMKHLDIDLHVYTGTLRPEQGFAVIARIAARTAVRRMEFLDLSATDEKCLEWHLYLPDEEGDLWQVDMIQILKGSRYDGHFGRIADRIAARLTPELKRTILRIKHDVPDGTKAAGIEICRAALDDGITDYQEFIRWKRTHPDGSSMEWLP